MKGTVQGNSVQSKKSSCFKAGEWLSWVTGLTEHRDWFISVFLLESLQSVKRHL
jgi:hypothetical protein